MEHLGPEMGFESADLGGLDFPGDSEHSISTASSLLANLPGVGTYTSSGSGGPVTIFSGGSLDLQDYTTLSHNMTISGLDHDLASLSKGDGSGNSAASLVGLYTHPQGIAAAPADLTRHPACPTSGLGMGHIQTHSPVEDFHSTSVAQSMPSMAVTSRSPLASMERMERLVSPSSFDVDAFLIRSTEQSLGEGAPVAALTSVAGMGSADGMLQRSPMGLSQRSDRATGNMVQTLKNGGTLDEPNQDYLQQMPGPLLQSVTDGNLGLPVSTPTFTSSGAESQQLGAVERYVLKDSAVDHYSIKLEDRLELEQHSSSLGSTPQVQPQDQGVSQLPIHQTDLTTQSSQGILTLPSGMTYQIAPNLTTQSSQQELQPVVHVVRPVSHHSSATQRMLHNFPTSEKTEQQFLGIGGFTTLVTSTSLAKLRGNPNNVSSGVPPVTHPEAVSATMVTRSSSQLTEVVKIIPVSASLQHEKLSYLISKGSPQNMKSEEQVKMLNKDHDVGPEGEIVIPNAKSERTEVTYHVENSTSKDGNESKINEVQGLVVHVNVPSDKNFENCVTIKKNDSRIEMSGTHANKRINSCSEHRSELEKIDADNHDQDTGVIQNDAIPKCDIDHGHNYDGHGSEDDRDKDVVDTSTEIMEPESARGRWKRRWKGMQERAGGKENEEGVQYVEGQNDNVGENVDREDEEELHEEEDIEEMVEEYSQSQNQIHETYDANAGLSALLTASKTAFMDRMEVNMHVDDSQCVINEEGLKRWHCNDCPKSYTTKHNLITHKLGHSGIKPHCCMLCRKFFKQMSHLQTHMLTHGGIKPHVCSICHRGFTQASHMKRHMATHMERRPHVCQLCERGFAYPSELKAHMEKHKKSKDNTCEECGEKFETPKKVRQHQLMAHKNVAELTCKECGKVFTYPSQLRDHMVKHSDKRPYMCGECGMEFMKEHHLKAHQFTHTGLRPYICAICQRSFNQKANMQRHMLIHESSKKFKCEHCDRMFSQPQTLKAHQVTHADKKPFHCEICGKEFGRLHNLQGHMHMHQDSKPHICFCGSSFTLKGNLNRHKKVKHGLTETTECTDEEAAQILNSMSTGKRQPETSDQGDSSAAEDTPRKKRKSQPRKLLPENSEEDAAEVDRDSDDEWESDQEISLSPRVGNRTQLSQISKHIQFDAETGNVAGLEGSVEQQNSVEKLVNCSFGDGNNINIQLENATMKAEHNSGVGSTAVDGIESQPTMMIQGRKLASLLDKKFKQSKALNK